jgi:hypothetical protein
MNEDEQRMANHIERLKDQERAQKLGKKVLRRTARFYVGIAGFIYGVYFDFTQDSQGTLWSHIVGPFIFAGIGALLITMLMFALGM